MEKFKNKLKDILELLLLILIYILVPQIIGLFLYTVIGLSGTTSIYIGNIFVALIYIIKYRKMFKEALKNYFSKFSNNFSDSLKYWGIGLALMYIFNIILIYLVFNGNTSVNEELNRQSISSYPIIGFISISFVAPLVEEMLFRYGLRKVTGKTKYFPLITALLFGGVHTLAGIGSSLKELLFIFPYGALGYIFGLLYNKSDNIISSIISHSIHNTICFIIIMVAV